MQQQAAFSVLQKKLEDCHSKEADASYDGDDKMSCMSDAAAATQIPGLPPRIHRYRKVPLGHKV